MCTCFRYNGNSTVDLILTDKNVQNKVKYFKVLPLTEWSDHCEIKTELTIKPREKLLGNNKYCTKVNKNFKWDESSDLKVNNYVNSVEFKEMTKSIIEKLKTESISRNSIDKRVEELTEILIKVSTKCLKITKNRHKSSKPNQKKYFDIDCHNMRREVRRLAIILSKSPHDIDIRNSYHQTKKQHKQILKVKKRNFKEMTLKRLNNLRGILIVVRVKF